MPDVRGLTATKPKCREGSALEVVGLGEGSAFEHLEVEAMQNLIQNHRRLIASCVVAILVATAIVLLVPYSGGGGGGPY